MVARRFARVEPVSGRQRVTKPVGRSALRGRVKSDGQWKLCCLVHKIGEVAHHGHSQ